MQTYIKPKLNSIRFASRLLSFAFCGRLKQIFILMQSLLQAGAHPRGLSGGGLHQVGVEANDEAPRAGVHLALPPTEGGYQGGEGLQHKTHLRHSVGSQWDRGGEVLIRDVLTENLLEPVQQARHGQLVGHLAVLTGQSHLAQEVCCLVQLLVAVGQRIVFVEAVLQQRLEADLGKVLPRMR